MGNGGCLGWAHGLMGETRGLAQAWFYLLQMSQCRWEDIGNNGSRSTLQTEKHLIYGKGHYKWHYNSQSVECYGPVSGWTSWGSLVWSSMVWWQQIDHPPVTISQ